jgi:hypothetical protein
MNLVGTSGKKILQITKVSTPPQGAPPRGSQFHSRALVLAHGEFPPDTATSFTAQHSERVCWNP